MFFDPFSFTPPSPAVLSRAVESYQRVAAARFCRYARDAANPDLWPRKMSGDGLEPTSKQLHAEVRALRHLTAIQRTLREIGGPLFDPDSPLSPEQRFRLVERRLDEIEDALGDGELGAEPARHSLGDGGSACSASSSSDFSSSDLFSPDSASRSSRASCVENSSSDFPFSSSAEKPDFYHPPEIEDLLEAVNFAQHVFAARAELLDKRRLELSPEDFLLEIAALRDLTAIVRTLRRMSAQPLPEDASPEDFQRGLAAETCTRPGSATASGDAGPASSPSNPVNHVNPVDSSSSSSLVNSVQSDLRSRPVPRVPEVRRITPRRNGATPPPPPVPPSTSTAPDPDFPNPQSEIPNPKSEIPASPPSDASYPSDSSDSSHKTRASHTPYAPPVLHDKDPP